MGEEHIVAYHRLLTENGEKQRTIDRLTAENQGLRDLVEVGAKYLEEMSSADGSGHKDLGAEIRRRLAALLEKKE